MRAWRNAEIYVSVRKIKRGKLKCPTLSMAAPASEDVVMDPVHAAGNQKGKNRQDGNEADDETDPEDEVYINN